MNDAVSQKRPRIRESPKLYARLRREILERDGWRCQKCGHSGNLDVHHVNRRNAVGDDAETDCPVAGDWVSFHLETRNQVQVHIFQVSKSHAR